MDDPDWRALDDAADVRDRFTDELKRTLGEPELVTDPIDGITRPTWTLEVPMDDLERICSQRTTRPGIVDMLMLDESEGGESD